MRADCFYRRYNRDRARMFSARNVAEVLVEVPVDASLADILAAAYSAARKVPGDRATGIYEVQTDLGIYRSSDERCIDLTTAVGRARVSFRTWEQLDADEAAEDAAATA